MNVKDFYESDLTEWFRKLTTRQKNVFLEFTYWCTTETKAHQRARGFYIFCKAHKIENVKQLEDVAIEKGLFDE